MTAPLTDEYLAEIEARRRAATPHVYTNGISLFHDSRTQVCCGRGVGGCCLNPVQDGEYYDIASFEREEDAQFYGHAPADIDALLAEVRRLREEIETLESALQDAEQRSDTAYTHGYNTAKYGGYKI